MQLAHAFDAIDVHVAGTPIRVITSGIPALRGETMAQKMGQMQHHYDWIRECVTRRPRAYDAVVAAVVTEPVSEDAAAGVFFMDMLTYQPMCGAGIFGVLKALAETGTIALEAPETAVVLDTPSGRLRASIQVSDHAIRDIAFENVPSFLVHKDLPLELPGRGKIAVDIVFGGNFFTIVEVEKLGLTIGQETIKDFKGLQPLVLEAANAAVAVRHPLEKHIDYMDQVLFVQESDDRQQGFLAQCIFGDRQPDNSPCGTGTCARMASRYFKGALALDDDFKQLNVTGAGAFRGKLIGETKVGPFDAVIPIVACRDLHIIGFNNLVVEQNDNLKRGMGSR
jgi:proline racemase/trans-L-3-hydroxyproline dehydratase